MKESGISTYFKGDRIRIRFKTIEELEYPEYIHIRINEDKKQLFLEKCQRDMDAFHIIYSCVDEEKKVKTQSCYINAKNFLKHLADVIGVPYDSPSLRFVGQRMPDGTVFIDLRRYEVIGARQAADKAADVTTRNRK